MYTFILPIMLRINLTRIVVKLLISSGNVSYIELCMFIQSFFADMFLKGCTNFGDNDKNDPHWFPCDLSKHQVKKKNRKCLM